MMKTSFSFSRPVGLLLAVSGLMAGLGLLAGCPSNSSGTSQAVVPQAKGFSGTVYGGQQPVVGATVKLYAAGGSSAIVLATATTTTGGAFTIPDSYTSLCPTPDAPIYIVASGGNPGLLPPGTDNTAIKLVAAISNSCSVPPPFVHISEVTTVAAAYALDGFFYANDSVHGPSPALDNAMQTAFFLLANSQNGQASPFLPAPSACTGGAPPVNCGALERMNTLANALAACVNTPSASSTPCMTLFACANPGATYNSGTCTGGTETITDTLLAAIAIASHPGQTSAGGIFDLAGPSPIFTPVLAAAPPDWTLALNFNDTGLVNARGISVDANGYIWVADINTSRLYKITPMGVRSLRTSGHLGQPLGVAIDAGGNVYVSNHISSGGFEHSVSKFTNAGTHVTTFSGGGLWIPFGVAVAPNGHIFVANTGEQNPNPNIGNSVGEFDSDGTPISPAPSAYTAGGIQNPRQLAVDASGIVWVANGGSPSSITRLDPGTSPPTGTNITGGGLSGAKAIAVGPFGNIWVYNSAGSLSKFNSSGSPLSPATGFTGGGIGGGAWGLAIDALGHVWTANDNDSVSEFDNNGDPLSPSTGFAGPWFDQARSIAVDASGNVWVGNQTGGITELVGAATPTRTPIISAITQGFTP